MRTRLCPAGILLALGCALALAGGGCSDEDEEILTPPIIGPDPVSNAVEPFVASYEDMDLGGLEEVLHEDFKMILLDGTRLDWEMPLDENFERAEFLEIHRRIFRGDAGYEPDGTTVAPVDAIVCDQFEARDAWADIPAGDPNFGGAVGRMAPYYVTLRFVDADLTHEYLVQHDVAVYTAPDTTGSGIIYRLLGLCPMEVDGAAAKVSSAVPDTESVFWDRVCALYAIEPNLIGPDEKGER